jgi:hypothetical protein
MLSFISSGFLLSKPLRTGSGDAARILHVFHLHYDVSIPETARRYDVSSAEIRALLSNARYTYLNLRIPDTAEPQLKQLQSADLHT